MTVRAACVAVVLHRRALRASVLTVEGVFQGTACDVTVLNCVGCASRGRVHAVEPVAELASAPLCLPDAACFAAGTGFFTAVPYWRGKAERLVGSARPVTGRKAAGWSVRSVRCMTWLADMVLGAGTAASLRGVE